MRCMCGWKLYLFKVFQYCSSSGLVFVEDLVKLKLKITIVSAFLTMFVFDSLWNRQAQNMSFCGYVPSLKNYWFLWK
ncbi:hypothetical protein HHI36_023987 [Cryptolaemus montrouzieri]|uniref:Uncharacterized protein n=1 Tax=Cryptolaemus montrouzieri TaxID=559131 RepID=A0ABD2P3N0_9CUCU